MALTDKKIGPDAVAEVWVQSQPDRLTGTPGQNKEKFDALPNLIIEKYNSAIDEIDGTFTSQSTALSEAVSALEEEIAGVEGTPGPAGPPGPTGERGPQGLQGPQGEQGPQGLTGPQGAQGIQGVKGDTGAQGPQGEQGPRGLQGQRGPKGDPGQDGADGSSFTILGMYATLAALEADHPTGSTGDAYAVGTAASNTVYNWSTITDSWQDIGSLKGPKGDTGDTGPQGIQGETGLQGPQGLQGIQGERGPQGIQGPKGDTGDTGPQGPQGLQGPQGEPGPAATVDDAMSSSSENPVQNKVIYTALDGKEPVISTKKTAFNRNFVVSDNGRNVPAMDGIGDVGSSTDVARWDHVHPTDTSRADATDVDIAVGDAIISHFATLGITLTGGTDTTKTALDALAQKATTATFFKGTKGSSISAGYCYGVYVPLTGLVVLVWGVNNGSTSISTGTDLFTVDAAYRPTSHAKRGVMMYGTSSSGSLSDSQYCTINTNGGIRQPASNSFKKGFGVIAYSVFDPGDPSQ